MKRLIVLFLPVLFVGMNLQGATDCVFVTAGSMMTLQASCMTDSSLVVPDGFTMNLNGFTVTGLDPSVGHFLGGVIQKYGGTANVTNGTITVSNLVVACNAGADRLRGVLFDGASGFITNLKILNIHQDAVLSGCQEGNGIEVRNFGTSPTTVSAFIDGNTVSGYQKTGIVVNGDSYGTVTNNTVSGFGPQNDLAQNGIQIGFGATAQVKNNTVSGNAYTGTSTVSGGIIVVAGPYYESDYSVGDQIEGNTVTGNDVGVWLTQIDKFSNPPAIQTNIKVVNNTITNSLLTNGYIYQAGVADQGNNDKIVNNKISGVGYDPATLPGSTFYVDADVSFTNRPKVHANK